MHIAQKPYLPNTTYWLLVGVDITHNGRFYRYDLLGKYIKGKFEFRNNDAKDGYIFREDLSSTMRLPDSDTESDT
jgi:hypothetical protein